MDEPKDQESRLAEISTRWSLLLEANRREGDAAREAQRLLLLRYYGAVYRYLLGATGNQDAAEVLSQEFAVRFVRGDFSRANPERGRFRDFLKTALRNLATDYHRERLRQPAHLPADADRLPAPEVPSAQLWSTDEAFLRHWRQTLLDSAWEAMAKSQSQTGPPFYEVLRRRAQQPEVSAAELADQLGRELGQSFTDSGIRQILKRARAQYAELLLGEIARSLQTDELDRLEQELIDLDLVRYCQSALAKRRHGHS
jgi:RNA polymerase sigma-70 factor (ECF subfamily)